MKGKGLLWLFILLLVVSGLSGLGCGTRQTDMAVQLYKYPDVLLPTPAKVILTRDTAGKTLAETALTRSDITSLMRVMRSAVDTSLHPEPGQEGAWQNNKPFSLEFSYSKNVDVELMVDNKPVTFSTQSILINLKRSLILLNVKNEVKVFSGLLLTDEFRTFMQEYNADDGFPLPPAKKNELGVKRLPLAKPREGKVELLPPAEPRNKTPSVH